MRRRDLRQIVKELAVEMEQRGYAYWRDREYPIAFDMQIAGEVLQIEHVLLEDEPSYLHISVSASRDTFLDSHCPVAVSFIVSRTADE